ncbi:hypothetical protein BU17DRAFT_66526 [Hysterangium stoloniferum]|nr:hypothetical protein BU17DRAFT_66526 [Hysterangium stoloniferum]
MSGSISGPEPVLSEWCCSAYFTGHIPVVENDVNDDGGLDALSQVTATQRPDIAWSLYVSWRLQWQCDDCPDAFPGVKLKPARTSPTVNTAEVNGIDVDVIGCAEALHLVRHIVTTHIIIQRHLLLSCNGQGRTQVERYMRVQPHMIAGLEPVLASMAAAFPA